MEEKLLTLNSCYCCWRNSIWSYFFHFYDASLLELLYAPLNLIPYYHFKDFLKIWSNLIGNLLTKTINDWFQCYFPLIQHCHLELGSRPSWYHQVTQRAEFSHYLFLVSLLICLNSLKMALSLLWPPRKSFLKLYHRQHFYSFSFPSIWYYSLQTMSPDSSRKKMPLLVHKHLH